MLAYELIIDSKVKPSPFSIVSADDFRIHTRRSTNPHIILAQPTSSLYCLDPANKRARLAPLRSASA